jgi:hypothetical protein
VVTLAVPLHPPGRPDRSRAAELELVRAAGLPLLAVQGERDAFGGPDELPPGLDVRAVPGDHSLRRPAELAELVVAAVRDWVLALE